MSLNIEDLKVSLQKKEILHGISLEIQEGIRYAERILCADTIAAALSTTHFFVTYAKACATCFCACAIYFSKAIAS